jgi:heme oxygenase
MDVSPSNLPPLLLLSGRLRLETKVAHRIVESTRLARAFFRGTLTTKAYAEGLARLHPVYAAMEAVLANVTPEDRLHPFNLPSVFRSDAILADLRYFGVEPEPLRAGASTAYVERIRQVVQETKPLLVAHAYVRFMADVSGGLIAGKIAQRVLKLPSREGLAFLSFPNIPDASLFRNDFRRRLDAFPRDEKESLEIVAEANQAFELNRRLADELWEELLSR